MKSREEIDLTCIPYLHNLYSDGADSIVDEFAYCWMPVLPDGVVVFPRFQEGSVRVYVSFVED